MYWPDFDWDSLPDEDDGFDDQAKGSEDAPRDRTDRTPRYGPARAYDTGPRRDPAPPPRRSEPPPRGDTTQPRYEPKPGLDSASPFGFSDPRRTGPIPVPREPYGGAPPRNGARRPLPPPAYAEPPPPVRRVEARPPDDDEDELREHGFVGAAIGTVLWYVVPALGYLGWTLLLGRKTRPGCVDAVGAPCLPPRDQALHNLVHDLPRLGVAIAISLLVALLIRLVTPIWRGLSVGFAAAVVGAGVATVLFSVLTGTAGG